MLTAKFSMMTTESAKSAVAAACALLSSSFVMAEEAGKAAALQTVTVTANKVEEKLKNVPQAVTLITGEELHEKGVRNVADLLRQIPNLSSSFVYSNDVNFRGINSSIFTNANPVVIYVDGVPQSIRLAYDALLENVDRVEVLRGPQGSLYGKDAIGGVINIVTKPPSNRWQGYAGAELANQSGRQLTAGVDGPLVKDRLYLSFSGRLTRDDGWITNQQPGRDPNANGRDEQLFRLGLHYKASPDTSLRLSASRDDLRNDFIDGGRAPPDVDLGSYTRDQARRTRFGELTTTKTINDAQSLSLKHRFVVGTTLDAVLTNKTVRFDGDYDVDFGDNPIFQGLISFQHGKFDTQTQELRLSGGQQGSLRWIGGIYHEAEEFRNFRYGTQLPGALVGQPFNVNIDVPSLTCTDTLAGFGQVMWPVAMGWELTLGGRYQRIKKDFDSEVYSTPVGTSGVPPQFNIKASMTRTAFLPKAAVSFDLTPRWRAYASVARGYLPGGFNYFPSSPVVADNQFEAQTSTNYETGIRSDFGPFYLSAALFRMDIKDLHVYTPDTTGIVIVTSNAGRGTSKGIELEGAYRPTDGLELSAALGWTRATYDSYPNPAVDGNRIEKTPSYTARISIQYNAPNGLFARADLNGTGKRYFNPENTLSEGSYATIDLRLGYQRTAWELYAYVRNATDTAYVTSALAYQGLGSVVTFGEPRRLGIGARYRF